MTEKSPAEKHVERACRLLELAAHVYDERARYLLAECADELMRLAGESSASTELHPTELA